MKQATIDNPNGYFNALADELAERAAQLRPLWAMTSHERLAMFHRGEMTDDQRYAWAARCPREVPRINGEFAFIAASTPEACVSCPVCGDDEVMLAADGQLAKHPDHRHTWNPSMPSGSRPTCPASAVTPADAVALKTTTTAAPEHALAA